MFKNISKFDLQTRFVEHLFFANILNCMLKNMLKLDLQKLPSQFSMPALFEHVPSQRYSITWSKTCQNSTSKTAQPVSHASTFWTHLFCKDTQLLAQKHTKTRTSKLPSQPPMPALFQHLFFAKIFNYVFENMSKFDLQTRFLNTSSSQIYLIACSKTC